VLEGLDRRAGLTTVSTTVSSVSAVSTTVSWKPESGPVDLLDVISDVLEGCQPAASHADVQLVAKFDCGLCSVPAQPARLEQILRSILGNALAFTPRGGALEVSASTEQSFIDIVVREGAGRGPTIRIRTPRAEPAPTH
jgi:signal transduction histidine kinase